MDPELAKMAMEQMSKMTPQQVAQMQEQMQNMDPSMMQAAMAQMNSMSSADKSRMREQMQNIDPSQVPIGNAQASMSQFQAQQNYEYQASVTLKNEGNTFHKQGRFQEAVDKYRRAHTNMAAHTSAQGKDLKKACALNLSAGLLKLGKNDEAVTFAGEVLAEDPANIKALYRRGQAHAALGSLEDAAKDLQMAVAASPADAAIKGKLDEVTGQLKAAGKAIPEPVDPSTLPKPKPAAAAAPAAPPNPAAMLKDPNTRQMMSSMMKNMTDDDLRRMAQMSGAPPGMSIEQMRKQYEQLEEMDEEEINRMAEMSSRAAAANPMANLSETDKMAQMQEMFSKDPDSMKKMMETVSQMPQEQLDAMMQASGAPAGMKMTPDMVKMSADMMAKVSPEDLEKMAKMRAGGAPAAGAASSSAGASQNIEDITPPNAMPTAGGMPQMTPGMASMAANMMSSMTPEDMQRMQQMASQMGGGGAGMMGGPGGMTPEQQAKMQQEMLSNPDTLKMVQNMMQSMDPKTMAALSKQAGMELSEEQAAQMADTMKNIKPEHMEKLMKVAGYAQGAKQKLVDAKNFLFSKTAFWLSLLMLFLAIALRYFNVM